MQAGHERHPAGTLTQGATCTGVQGGPDRRHVEVHSSPYGLEAFPRAAPRWQRLPGKLGLSPMGRSIQEQCPPLFRPSAVSWSAEAREGERARRPTPGLCPRDGSSGPSTGQPGFQGYEAGKRRTGGRQG